MDKRLAPAPADHDRDGGGWLLRTLKDGEQAILADTIIVEMRIMPSGRPRLAIQAPREVRVRFSRADPPRRA